MVDGIFGDIAAKRGIGLLKACGRPQRRAAVLGEGVARAQERSLQEKDRRGGARQQPGAHRLCDIVERGDIGRPAGSGASVRRRRCARTFMTPQGRAAERNIWAERRGPEPPAAVKDAFGAASAVPPILTASTSSPLATIVHHLLRPAPRRSRWSKQGPRRQARSLQSFAGDGEQRSRGDNGVM